MPLGPSEAEEGPQAGECRQCRTFCDRLVEPRGCLEHRCCYLYSYVDPLTRRPLHGLHAQGVPGRDRRRRCSRPRSASGGYGGIKMTGEPLPQCQFRVEPSYERDGPGHECVNPASSTADRRRPRGHPRLRPPRRARRSCVAPSSSPSRRHGRVARLRAPLDLLAVRAVPSGPGVSISAGRLSKRGSERNAAKPLAAELALAEVGVAVAVGAQRHLRVVDVDAAEPLEPDLGVEVVEHLAERRRASGSRSRRRAGGSSRGRPRAACRRRRRR